MAVVDTKLVYEGMYNRRSAQQESGAVHVVKELEDSWNKVKIIIIRLRK